jgi:hypothetical protein
VKVESHAGPDEYGDLQFSEIFDMDESDSNTPPKSNEAGKHPRVGGASYEEAA